MFSSGRTEALASDSLFFVFVFFIIYINSRNTKKRIIPGHCLCQNVFLVMALSVVRVFLLGWKKWHMSTQATIFLHVAANCFFAIRNIVESSSGFPSSLYNWLIKIFFLLFRFNFQVRKKHAGQSFLAMKEVQDNQIKVLSCTQRSHVTVWTWWSSSKF